ncbi:hypothetical protein ACJX0J_003841 [Zea mays]
MNRYWLIRIMAVVSIEEIKEVEKFVDLWLKKKNKKTGVLLNFKGLRRLLGKRQRLLAYLAKKNRVRYKKLISHCISFFLLHPKSSFLDSFLQGNFENSNSEKKNKQIHKRYML